MRKRKRKGRKPKHWAVIRRGGTTLRSQFPQIKLEERQIAFKRLRRNTCDTVRITRNRLTGLPSIILVMLPCDKSSIQIIQREYLGNPFFTYIRREVCTKYPERRGISHDKQNHTPYTLKGHAFKKKPPNEPCLSRAFTR